MTTLDRAMEKLRAENPPPAPCPVAAGCDPDCCTGDCTNVVISDMVGHLVLEALGPEWVDFGTFDNCREYGLTFTVPGWQFCVYEHRNSDKICVQGCPIGEVNPWGPYGGVDKWDVLASARYEMYGAAAAFLIDALRFVNRNPNATRDEVKRAIADAAEVRS